MVIDVSLWPGVGFPSRESVTSQREVLDVWRPLECPCGQNDCVKQGLSPLPLTCEISFRFD